MKKSEVDALRECVRNNALSPAQNDAVLALIADAEHFATGLADREEHGFECDGDGSDDENDCVCGLYRALDFMGLD